jgi:hypothetical protein
MTGKLVLWVIREKDTDYVFPRLKDARASEFGWGLKTGLRIISKVVLDKVNSCTYNRKKKGVLCKIQQT